MKAIYKNAKQERAAFLKEHRDVGKALLQYVGGDLEEAKRLMKQCYRGEYDGEDAFARDYVDQFELMGADMFKHLAPYVNFERYASDLFREEYFSIEADGMTHVFLRAYPKSFYPIKR